MFLLARITNCKRLSGIAQALLSRADARVCALATATAPLWFITRGAFLLPHHIARQRGSRTRAAYWFRGSLASRVL